MWFVKRLLPLMIAAMAILPVAEASLFKRQPNYRYKTPKLKYKKPKIRGQKKNMNAIKRRH